MDDGGAFEERLKHEAKVAVASAEHVHHPGIRRVRLHPDRVGRADFVVDEGGGHRGRGSVHVHAAQRRIRRRAAFGARGRGPCVAHATRCACASRPADIVRLPGPARPGCTIRPLGPARAVRPVASARAAVHAAPPARTDVDSAVPVAFLLEPDPYEALPLRARVGAYPDRRGRREPRMAGYRDAPGGARFVGPAVVAALERMAEVGPDGEPDPPVGTPVLPCVHGPVVCAPDRELLSEQGGVDDVPGHGVPAPAYRKPAAAETFGKRSIHGFATLGPSPARSSPHGYDRQAIEPCGPGRLRRPESRRRSRRARPATGGRRATWRRPVPGSPPGDRAAAAWGARFPGSACPARK